MRYVPQLGSAILVALTLLSSAGPAWTADEALGSVSGMVTDSETKLGMGFAEVSVLGTKRGALADEAGRFRITKLQPGSYTIKAKMMGYESASAQAYVRAGLETDLRMELLPWGFNVASRESIRIAARLDTNDIECEIRPGKRKFRVGDSAGFTVRIHNRAPLPLWLVRSLDGSTDRARFPHVILEIAGPAGGYHVPAYIGCGNINALREVDFVLVYPGEPFDPFEKGPLPYSLRSGRFIKPGKYVATFRYSTNEPDVRKWLGWPPTQTMSDNISQRLRNVPLLDLACSVEFVVER
jgi:hypothetical protein